MASTTKKPGARKASAEAAPARKAPVGKPAVKKAPAAAGNAAARRAPARKAPAKKAPARKALAKKPPAKKAPVRKALAKKPPAKKAPVRKAPASRRSSLQPPAVGERSPTVVPGLSEEDQIRAAKYLPRELPRKVFEEDRFLFPETYGVNRVRLLVRDPEWIFAYWDVSPAAMKDLGRRLGERGLALSRLTLRVVDPVSGASSDILLPPGARWWYVRTDAARRTYRAELGVTLPSGAFHPLASSNTVVTPRVGPSAERARRRMSYRDARELPLSAAEAARLAEASAGVAAEPWEPGSIGGAAAPSGTGRSPQGGASDAFGPGGAGEAPRPGGASDTFRR